MGGGQANSGQASTAASQQTAANNQDMKLSRQYGAQEQEIFNRLFGAGGSGGTLSSFMDPASLTQSKFNPAYQAQWNQAQQQIAQNYKQQRGALAQGWANSGLTPNATPSGFGADQMRKLASSEADTRGATYAGLKGEQYQDALSNFWNANNLASGSSATATGGSTTGAGNAGSSSAQIYGTAGQYHPSGALGVIQSGIGAAGQIGAAAMTGGGSTAAQGASQCPAEGSLILMSDGTRRAIEELKKGDRVIGVDGKPDDLVADPDVTIQEVCIVRTQEMTAKVSLTHAFVRHAGGYTIAAKSLGEKVDTDHGPQHILEVKMTGEKMPCFHLFLKRSHGFNVDGMWSLE